MKNNPFCPNSICSFNLCSQKLHRNLKSFRLYSIPKINYIRSMHNNIININIILLHKFKPSFNIQFFNRLSPCILRCSSINHKSIRSIRNCFLNRSQKHIFPTHSHMWSDFKNFFFWHFFFTFLYFYCFFFLFKTGSSSYIASNKFFKNSLFSTSSTSNISFAPS